MGVLFQQGTQKHFKMGKGQNEGGFSDEQKQMYADCFKLMDINKDGTIDKNDLRGAFDNVGVLMSEGDLDSLLGEISGPCTLDNMINMFQRRWPERETTVMTSSYRHSRLTSSRERSTPRCSPTHSRPGETKCLRLRSMMSSENSRSMKII